MLSRVGNLKWNLSCEELNLLLKLEQVPREWDGIWYMLVCMYEEETKLLDLLKLAKSATREAVGKETVSQKLNQNHAFSYINNNTKFY